MILRYVPVNPPRIPKGLPAHFEIPGFLSLGLASTVPNLYGRTSDPRGVAKNGACIPRRVESIGRVSTNGRIAMEARGPQRGIRHFVLREDHFQSVLVCLSPSHPLGCFDTWGASHGSTEVSVVIA